MGFDEHFFFIYFLIKSLVAKILAKLTGYFCLLQASVADKKKVQGVRLTPFYFKMLTFFLRNVTFLGYALNI